MYNYIYLHIYKIYVATYASGRAPPKPAKLLPIHANLKARTGTSSCMRATHTHTQHNDA